MDNLKFLIEKLKQLYKKGLFHIMGSSIINKILFFIGNVFAVRFLTKAEYGAFAYADSIMAFVITLNGLGLTNGLLQFASESEYLEKRYAIKQYTLKLGIIISTVTSIFCLIVTLLFDFKINGIKWLLLIYSFYPLVYYLFKYYQVYTRAAKDNVSFSRMTNLDALIYVGVEIVGTYFWDESAIILAMYISSIIATMYGMSVTKKYDDGSRVALTKNEKKEIFKYSFLTSINTLVTNLTGFVDVFLIGVLVLDKDLIATYKVATVIPLALMFIPDAVMMFVYPYFAENKNNKEWIRENTIKLFKISFLMNVFITVSLAIGAPLIISIIWGEKYAEASGILMLLAVNYFFSATFRYNIISILSSLRKMKSVLAINIVSAVLIVIFDITLIKYMGIVGAAISSILVMVITSLALLPVIYKELKK